MTFDAHVRELSGVVASLSRETGGGRESRRAAATRRRTPRRNDATDDERRRRFARRKAAEEAREAKCAAELDAARARRTPPRRRERAAEEIARARDVALRRLREGVPTRKEGADELKEGADEMDAAEGEAPRARTVETASRAHLAELAECRRQRDVAEADVREATRRLRANAEDLFDARREIARLQATLRRRERAAEAENDAVGDVEVAADVASPEVDALLRDAPTPPRDAGRCRD